MPLYTLRCDCGECGDFLLGANFEQNEAACSACGHILTVPENMAWDKNAPVIHMDTHAGFDPGLNQYVSGRRQHREILKAKGLEEQPLDSGMKKTFKERDYIRKHSRHGDKDAAKALDREAKTASDNRRETAVKDAFSKVTLPNLSDLGA